MLQLGCVIMKIKSTAFRFLCIFSILFLLLPLPLIVKAKETKLTTIVPSAHMLIIEISGKGIVSVDGKQYSKSTGTLISRQTTLLIEIKPANNYCLDTVSFNGENITKAMSNGKWTMSNMIADAVIKVDFEPESDIPATGDTSNICLWFILMLLSFIGLNICFWTGRKGNKKTEYP